MASRGGSSPAAIEASRPPKPGSRMATRVAAPSMPRAHRASAPMRNVPWETTAWADAVAAARRATAAMPVSRGFMRPSGKQKARG